MLMPSTEEQVRRKARVLASFMSQAEAAGFANGFAIDPKDFLAQWSARVGARPKIPAGYTAPRVEPLTPDAAAHVSALLAVPAFSAFYASAGAALEFKNVELGRLLAFQHWMDTDVSDGVHGGGTSTTPTAAQILEKCLPPGVVPNALMRWQPQQFPDRTSVTVYSHNNTLGYNMGIDEGNGLVQFLVHAAPNLMLVKEHAGRYVLANGYHRAWWLRSKGVEMVPVALLHVPAREQLTQPGAVQAADLLSDRPPIVDHFLSDEFAVMVDVRSMLRVVRITAEVSFVPRLL